MLLLYLCGIALMTSVCEGSGCDVIQKHVMRVQWTRLWHNTDDQYWISLEVWRNMFAVYPEMAGEFFAHRHAHENPAHHNFLAFAWRTLRGFDTVVRGLLKDQELESRFLYIGRIHAQEKYIHPSYYQAFVTAVADIGEYALGPRVHRQAWIHCGQYIIQGVQRYNY